MKWTAGILKKRRRVKKLSKGEMARRLGMSPPTYKKLEEGVGLDRYANRLNKYYLGGYTEEQMKILIELNLTNLIDEKERDRTKHK